MHIPDNYLSPQTDAVMAVAMVPVWVHCIKKVRATLDREHVAFLGICAAFSFLLMMFNVPLPGGTTGHAVGGALIALLLGPEAAAIAVSVALALQALLFGDGVHGALTQLTILDATLSEAGSAAVNERASGVAASRTGAFVLTNDGVLSYGLDGVFYGATVTEAKPLAMVNGRKLLLLEQGEVSVFEPLAPPSASVG